MQWYVLRVAANKEVAVRDALSQKVKMEGLGDIVGRIEVPVEQVKRIRGGKQTVHKRKLYPGYVFVEMALEEDGSIPERAWFVIKETMGVGDFIGSGGKPTPMGPREVEKMLAQVDRKEDQPGLNIEFKKGDMVGAL